MSEVSVASPSMKSLMTASKQGRNLQKDTSVAEAKALNEKKPQGNKNIKNLIKLSHMNR